MKKFLATILCTGVLLNFVCAPAFCKISDDFAESTLSKDLKFKPASSTNIQDIFVEESLNKNLIPKEYNYINIEDNLAKKLSNNIGQNYKTPERQFISDEILPAADYSNTNTKNPEMVNEIMISDTQNTIPVQIKIKKNLTTKEKLQEGNWIYFETLNDAKINNVSYKKGTQVKARIETISQNKIWGTPADLIIGNFSIGNTPLLGEINKTGANRALWLYPTVYFGTFLFGAGLLLIPIRGGHAKIKTTEKYTLYAEK